MVLRDNYLKGIFREIVRGCEAVICCEVDAYQKAQIVRLFKNEEKKITLAVGDGANDVMMINEAHIGIGIYGNDGMHAVQASDFSIPELSCLWKLLFVHGRWSYQRTTDMILYFFYKNMVFTIPQFYYAFLCAYSGSSVYDDYYIMIYNVLFTSVPLLVWAILDRDIYYKKWYKTHQDTQELVGVDQRCKDMMPQFYYTS